jgi:hypothetical protein
LGFSGKTVSAPLGIDASGKTVSAPQIDLVSVRDRKAPADAEAQPGESEAPALDTEALPADADAPADAEAPTDAEAPPADGDRIDGDDGDLTSARMQQYVNSSLTTAVRQPQCNSSSVTAELQQTIDSTATTVLSVLTTALIMQRKSNCATASVCRQSEAFRSVHNVERSTGVRQASAVLTELKAKNDEFVHKIVHKSD